VPVPVPEIGHLERGVADEGGACRHSTTNGSTSTVSH